LPLFGTLFEISSDFVTSEVGYVSNKAYLWRENFITDMFEKNRRTKAPLAPIASAAAAKNSS